MSGLRATTAVPRVIAIAVVCAVGGISEAAHLHSLVSLSNGDFWWHLRVGLGILQSHALPHAGLYSQASTQPWIASSWLYDVLVAIGYRLFDLHVVPLAAMACKFALAVLTFLLAGGLRGRFCPALLLSGVAQYILLAMQPLPAYCSVLLFAVELLLLSRWHSDRTVPPAYFLPLLFLLWANLDVQFVIGILVLVLFLVTTAIAQRSARPEIAAIDFPPLTILGAVTAASLLATALTPYGPAGYRLFFAQVASAANAYFPDVQALRFRSPHDYLILLLVAAAFLALGMRRSRDPFQIALLLLCAFASFYTRPDAWMAVLAALFVLAANLPDAPAAAVQVQPRTSRPQLWLAVGLTCLLLVAAAVIHLPRSRQAMLARIGEAYPVVAADYIRDHHLPQPLFNSLPWGGFLAFYLPAYPVAIDGRTDLYGDDFNIQYAQVMNANAHFSTFPALNQAGTLLLEKKSLMGAALATVPGFEVAYSDNVAVVLVREQSQP